jgi:hypothetical protein
VSQDAKNYGFYQENFKPFLCGKLFPNRHTWYWEVANISYRQSLLAFLYSSDLGRKETPNNNRVMDCRAVLSLIATKRRLYRSFLLLKGLPQNTTYHGGSSCEFHLNIR